MRPIFGNRWFCVARLLLLSDLILLACVPTTTCAFAQDAPSEYQVKAAVLFNLAKFVDWPVAAFATQQSPFNICILGDDPFGSALDQIVSGKKIEGRDVVVLRKRRTENLRICEILFVSRSEDKALGEVLNSMTGAMVLVIGESTDFAGRGGGIQFYMEDSKVRFRVNVDAVQRSHLVLSAKLLALAAIVHDSNHSNGS